MDKGLGKWRSLEKEIEKSKRFSELAFKVSVISLLIQIVVFILANQDKLIPL